MGSEGLKRKPHLPKGDQSRVFLRGKSRFATEFSIETVEFFFKGGLGGLLVQSLPGMAQADGFFGITQA